MEDPGATENPGGAGTGAPQYVRFLFILSIVLVAGCAQKPDAGVAERAITAHFKEEGYDVPDLSIGGISRNPVAEREYMAPLTYVVEVPSIVLKPGAAAEFAEKGRPIDELIFSDASIKILALSPPRQGWVVSSVRGIHLPLPAR